LLLMISILAFAFSSGAQQENCILKTPQVTIHFGAAGHVSDDNTMVPARYRRIDGYCPSDGYYTFTPYTSRCFRDDWLTLTEDHTAGDADGNMLLINSSPGSGMFFRTSVSGLKPNTRYEFSTWMMNVCKITEKCPFPLLPDITIHLQTAAGKNIAALNTGEVTRVHSPRWTQYNFIFTSPAAEGSIEIIMINHSPGGCGNDFAMDDITFRECIPPPPPPVAKKKPAVPVTKEPLAVKPVAKKVAATPPSAPKPVVKKAPATPPPRVPVARKPVAKKPAAKPAVKSSPPRPIVAAKTDSIRIAAPEIKRRTVLPPPPRVLTARSNTLVKVIETEAGNIRIDLFDNGEIDGDTVTIYHNNRMVVSRVRISQKPVTLNIAVNKEQPHHELVMVADNLGSIPPNTSLMIVTAGAKRYEVFISSTKQKNAKVVLELKE
jgi:hypothetical protein